MSQRDYTVKPALPQRLYSLDALRGIGAFSVVLFHWSEAFFVDQKQFSPPFQSVLGLFYSQGGRAVDFFFCLSGFVFFWLYSEKIIDQDVNIKQYVVLRLSRLYPLHLLTLLCMVLIPFFSLDAKIHYGANDNFFHFFLQLIFASNWFTAAYSFNSPIWSVSVEVFMYLVFFFLCRSKKTGWAWLVLLIVIGAAVQPLALSMLGRGLVGFFVGGLIYKITRFIIATKVTAGVLWICVAFSFLVFYLNLSDYDFYKYFFGGAFLVKNKDIIGGFLLIWQQLCYVIILFPVIIILSITSEVKYGIFIKRACQLLGDLSYSVYLIHVPLRLVYICLISISGINCSFFFSPEALMIYLLALGLLSYASHYYFEMPVQKLIRHQWF